MCVECLQECNDRYNGFSYSNDRHNDSVDEIGLHAGILREYLIRFHSFIFLIPRQPVQRKLNSSYRLINYNL